MGKAKPKAEERIAKKDETPTRRQTMKKVEGNNINLACRGNKQHCLHTNYYYYYYNNNYYYYY